MSLKFALAAATMTAAVGATAAAHAASTINIFNDLDSGGSSTAGHGWGATGNAALANSFVASAGGKVSEIDLDLWNAGGGDSATISLWTDVGGVLGAQLGSWSVSGLPHYTGYPLPLTRITSVSGVNLTAGDSYFVQVSAGSGLVAWLQNDQGSVSTILYNGAPYLKNQATGALQILGAAVPEPSTWAMLILGVAMIGVAIRRRNEGVAVAA